MPEGGLVRYGGSGWSCWPSRRLRRGLRSRASFFNVGGQRRGVGHHGGIVGDGELAAEERSDEGGGGPDGFGDGGAFGVSPGELEDVVDVAVKSGACVQVGR